MLGLEIKKFNLFSIIKLSKYGYLITVFLNSYFLLKLHLQCYGVN